MISDPFHTALIDAPPDQNSSSIRRAWNPVPTMLLPIADRIPLHCQGAFPELLILHLHCLAGWVQQIDRQILTGLCATVASSPGRYAYIGSALTGISLTNVVSVGG
jgi:hypothetical protein